MKRYLLALLFCLVVVACLVYYTPKPLHTRVDLSQAQCAIFCKQTSQRATSVGYGYIVECSGKSFGKAYKNCNQIDGVSFCFSASSFNLQNFEQKLALQQHFYQQLFDSTVICGYSSRIEGGVLVDGKLVNVQIAITKDTVTIGSPLILDSF